MVLLLPSLLYLFCVAIFTSDWASKGTNVFGKTVNLCLKKCGEGLVICSKEKKTRECPS